MTEFIVQDWGTEEHIQGAYSYQMPGATNDDRVVLSQDIDSKLYFAGEATSINGDFGTMQGALESAERVTEEIIANITNS
ncbi:MAG: FAD-dependent oxidoreductase [Bacteroidota bacterium]